MGETTLSRLFPKRRFPMKRFLIIALVGALSVAGGTGLAFGAGTGPQPGTKPPSTKASPTPAPGKTPPSMPQPQAKKPTPPPKKEPPSKPPTQPNKPPSHREVTVDVPKGGPMPPAKQDPAKPANSSKPGADTYSLADYKRDMDKAVKEGQDGSKEEALSALGIVAGAVGGGGAPGATAATILEGPQLVDSKILELKSNLDFWAANGKLVGAWINGTLK
jgi:hypothetical protein